jgi:hypothetical protein
VIPRRTRGASTRAHKEFNGAAANLFKVSHAGAPDSGRRGHWNRSPSTGPTFFRTFGDLIHLKLMRQF